MHSVVGFFCGHVVGGRRIVIIRVAGALYSGGKRLSVAEYGVGQSRGVGLGRRVGDVVKLESEDVAACVADGEEAAVGREGELHVFPVRHFPFLSGFRGEG